VLSNQDPEQFAFSGELCGAWTGKGGMLVLDVGGKKEPLFVATRFGEGLKLPRAANEPLQGAEKSGDSRRAGSSRRFSPISLQLVYSTGSQT
jgi:hypothetical protein